MELSRRELALIKVKGTGNKRLEALRLAEAFDAQTVDASLDSFVFQITGRTREIDRFINLMASVELTGSIKNWCRCVEKRCWKHIMP